MCYSLIKGSTLSVGNHFSQWKQISDLECFVNFFFVEKAHLIHGISNKNSSEVWNELY